MTKAQVGLARTTAAKAQVGFAGTTAAKAQVGLAGTTAAKAQVGVADLPCLFLLTALVLLLYTYCVFSLLIMNYRDSHLLAFGFGCKGPRTSVPDLVARVRRSARPC